MNQENTSASKTADPRVIEAATAAMVTAIEWDINIASENSKHSEWLTAFCTGGLAILITQAEKLVIPTAKPLHASTFALLFAALLFIAGAISGGIARRRLKRGIELKRQQNTFFLKQKAVAMADLVSGKESSAFLERLWQLHYLPEIERRQYLAVSRKDTDDQSEYKLIPLQEILTLLGYVVLIGLALLKTLVN